MLLVPDDDELFQRRFDIQARIESRAPRGYGPGGYLYYALSHYISSADDILFADLAVDTERTTYAGRYGRIFIVTARSVYLAEYANSIDEPDGDPNEDYGQASIAVYPRTDATRPALTWAERPLRLFQPSYGSEQRYARLEPGAISCTSSAWSVSLPGDDRVVDGDAYFAGLLGVFGLS